MKQLKKIRIQYPAVIFKLYVVLFLSFLLIPQKPLEAFSPKIKNLKTINIAFQEWVGYGPLYLAQEKGFFREEGLDVVFVDEQLDSARRDAFKAGILDCEAGTIDLLVSKRAQDTPIVAVLELDRSFGGDGIVAKEEIKSLKDLVGKKVAFSRDDVNETFISYLFHKQGLSLNDIIIISRAPEQVAVAFLNGEADAAVTWEPWLSRTLTMPGAHILISSKDAPGIIIDTLNVREDIVKNNPEIVKGLMRGWFKAVKYYKEHTREATKIISKHFNITPQEYENNVNNLQWTDYTKQISVENTKTIEDTFNTIVEIKFKNNRIAKKPNPKVAINTVLIRKIYENSK